MKTYYEQLGEGSSTIIYLHGWGASGSIFREVARRLPEYSNYLIDFAGFGQSEQPSLDGWTVFDYANQLIGFMSEQGIASATLVGHSFGCRVAMVVAATRPELVERLLLVAPAGLRRFSLKRWLKVKAYKLRKKLGLKNAEQSGSDDYRNCSDEMKRTFVKVVNQDLSRYAKRITSQTIIVNGRTDTATPLKHARRLNRLIKNSELVEINGDHFAFFYVPQAFADTVKIFVRQGVTS